MSRLITCLVAVLSISSCASTLRADGPTTRPGELSVTDLIGRLGADDFKVRQEAHDALRQRGKEALPELRDAAKSGDPEVMTRSEALIREIEKPPRQEVDDDLRDGGGIVIAPGGAHAEFRIQMGLGGKRSVVVRENNRTLTLREDEDGIRLKVTEPGEQGKLQTREYQAASADELKKQHPEAFAIYERLTKQNQVRVDVRALPIPPRLRVPPDIERMMRDRRQLQRLPASTTPRAEEYGIQVEEMDAAMKAQLGAGVLVVEVEPGSGAANLGLRQHDIVVRVDGSRIESIGDLEAALEKAEATRAEVIRGGKNLKLEARGDEKR